MAKTSKKKGARKTAANDSVQSSRSAKTSRDMRILPREGASFQGAVAVALVCALVLFQGGYYAGATCVISLVATAAFAIVAIVRRTWRQANAACFALLAISVLYAISSLAHGGAVSMLQETLSWLSLAGLALWFALPSTAEKVWTLDLMGLAGVVLSVGGLLMFAGVLPVEGAMNVGRLMFTFQYANTAGVFFAVCAMLCLCSGLRVLQILSVLPFAAMVCTQSGGALLTCALALVIVGIRWIVVKKPSAGKVGGAIAVVLVACVAGAWLLQGRIAQAMQTLVERFIQMSDALSVLGGNALLGIGPDQWQFAYPFVQTAQYRAASVHCSYLQVALDGDVVAMVLVVVVLVVGIWRAARRGELATALCAGMVSVHALVDFDLAFAAMVALLGLLLVAPRDNGVSTGQAPALHRIARHPAACWATIAIAIVASAAGIFLDTQAGSLQNAYARADAATAVEQYESADYLTSDKLMQVYVAGALYRAGSFEEAVTLTEGLEQPAANVSLVRFSSLVRLGREQEAQRVLTELLHAQPYNVELFKSVRATIADNSLGNDYEAAFDAEAQRANELAKQGHAAWLSGQETIELFG